MAARTGRSLVKSWKGLFWALNIGFLQFFFFCRYGYVQCPRKNQKTQFVTRFHKIASWIALCTLSDELNARSCLCDRVVTAARIFCSISASSNRLAEPQVCKAEQNFTQRCILPFVHNFCVGGMNSLALYLECRHPFRYCFCLYSGVFSNCISRVWHCMKGFIELFFAIGAMWVMLSLFVVSSVSDLQVESWCWEPSTSIYVWVQYYSSSSVHRGDKPLYHVKRRAESETLLRASDAETRCTCCCV